MNVKLIAHTELSDDFRKSLPDECFDDYYENPSYSHRAAVALTAIRTCYSHLKPTEIVTAEGEKYFGQSATDGEDGTEADRLIRHIVASKHTSTLEHITYTFAVEGVSRSLLAQLTRHRVGFSYSVQSQRYVRFGSEDKSGGFEYVTPPSTEDKWKKGVCATSMYEQFMKTAQMYYDVLREMGVPAEDARMVLPNAAACNIVMTVNLRALLDFYAKRKRGNGAQHEIAELAERLREEVVKVDQWTTKFFE
ncbi:FAD-dependent thymidylate synthase [Paenibacillus alvei]|uniref:FAD-dependent thymidylate synthase n=1 Tax=Paenibacillus alvei TaxID=44250 RepID=UPI0018CFE85A|nr:FAD-dependent thymidylate synthase [Paenibacillus alvei]MBG9736450.1 thymidylate synthase [Paenibacillus alvei]MBG9736480.1 thymidylate synthase [Paenibacillus alvei]MBG9736520.1 thymidylate synthase [Paenibacillus alvei]MBG9736591.1 thymidylate synthase [Paenibacillus alvei]MBG9745575.1 thymidylate synthase [Paenibacillus alvei]